MTHSPPSHSDGPPSHTRRRFLIAAGAGAAVTAAGIVVSTIPEDAPPATPDQPVDPDNPRGLREYEPVYDRAIRGLEAPLGFVDCSNPTGRSTRDTAGSDRHPVTPIIDRFVIHHTGTTTEQLDFLSHCNHRSSAPTFYLRHDGSVIELIRPGAKPSATGADWNWRSLAVETLDATGAPEYTVTEAQLEELAQMIAWLATFGGKSLDGVPVSFTIDREHVISHRETWSGTECPRAVPAVPARRHRRPRAGDLPRISRGRPTSGFTAPTQWTSSRRRGSGHLPPAAPTPTRCEGPRTYREPTSAESRPSPLRALLETAPREAAR